VKLLKLVYVALLTTALSGCGDSSGMNAAESQKSYDFVTPTLNVQRLYIQTITDNSNNTINESVSDTVTAVNPDGSYVVMRDDPNHDSVTVDGTTYAITPETINANYFGQETSYFFMGPKGNQVTCTFDPHGAGPDYPLTVGSSWTATYNFSCGTAPIVVYTQYGKVVDVESVTVPAGTFSTLKLQSTLSWTDAIGTTHTQSITNWRDVDAMFSVKQVILTSYSGTVPTHGYPVLTDIVLQSES
jgi:hypothetical protein